MKKHSVAADLEGKYNIAIAISLSIVLLHILSHKLYLFIFFFCWNLNEIPNCSKQSYVFMWETELEWGKEHITERVRIHRSPWIFTIIDSELSWIFLKFQHYFTTLNAILGLLEDTNILLPSKKSVEYETNCYLTIILEIQLLLSFSTKIYASSWNRHLKYYFTILI